MRLKKEVVVTDVAPAIWYALGRIDEIHMNLFRAGCIVTSLRDGIHNPGSLHPKGLAVDIRTSDLLGMDRQEFASAVSAALGPLGYDVVLEGLNATAATTSVHLHCEFDPKGAETFIPRLS